MNVVVLGASIKESKYSNIAVKALKDAGHRVIPIHPQYKEVHGIKILSSMKDIEDKVDTLSIYVGRQNTDLLIGDIINLKPDRIIFNPGSENYQLKEKAEASGIKVVFACTLVMLSAGSF